MQLPQRREGRVGRYRGNKQKSNSSTAVEPFSPFSGYYMPASLCLFYPYRLLHPPVHCGDVCVEDVGAQFLLSITCAHTPHTQNQITDTVYLSFSISVMASRSYITRQSSTAMKIFRCRPREVEGCCNNWYHLDLTSKLQLLPLLPNLGSVVFLLWSFTACWVDRFGERM